MTSIKGDLTSPSPLVGEGRGEGASLLENAKRLRSNMTDVEKKIWMQLRAKRFFGYKFYRQVPLGKYIPDFLCYEPKLIIELDGGQHAEQINYDQKRDAFFKEQGFMILRFWNNEVMQNMDGVLSVIIESLRARRVPLSLTLPHEGGGNI